MEDDQDGPYCFCGHTAASHEEQGCQGCAECGCGAHDGTDDTANWMHRYEEVGDARLPV